MVLTPPPSPLSLDDGVVMDVERAFRTTVNKIKKHLGQCNMDDLVTDFNMVVSKEKFPYFKDRVKEKLFKCRTISKVFVYISPYVNWQKRGILRALVEVSGCPEAIAELNQFEAQLNNNQSIMNLPIPSPSDKICPDERSDAMIIAIKSNKDLTKTTYGDLNRLESTIAQTGGVAEEDLDLQAKSIGSSILYWLIPKDVSKSFEENIRTHLDDLYDEGIVEILLDPNIVITTGRKLRVRSLAYLTTLPPPGAEPSGRIEVSCRLV